MKKLAILVLVFACGGSSEQPPEQDPETTTGVVACDPDPAFLAWESGDYIQVSRRMPDKTIQIQTTESETPFIIAFGSVNVYVTSNLDTCIIPYLSVE
jgi:hypothetical protein